MTLPENAISALRATDRDLAKAVVSLVTPKRRGVDATAPSPIELLQVTPRQYLITVDVATVKRLPRCQFVPLGSERAFLALEPGAGLADLVLAVGDRLEDADVDARERRALKRVRLVLRQWRLNRDISVVTRSIVLLRGAVRRNASTPSRRKARPSTAFN